MERPHQDIVVSRAEKASCRETFFGHGWIVAAAAGGVAGLLLPLAAIPGRFLAGLLGMPFVVAVPMAVVGAVVGAGFAVDRELSARTLSNFGAAAFGLGGLLAYGLGTRAGLAAPFGADASWPLVLAGLFGGVAFGLRTGLDATRTALLAAAAGIGFAVALHLAFTSGCLKGG